MKFKFARRQTGMNRLYHACIAIAREAAMADELDCGKHLNRRQRIVSTLESVAGVAFVLGHNVWRVLPNEVYLLFITGILSLWLRNGGLRNAGLRSPSSWRWTLAAAIVTALLLQLEDFITTPLSRLFTSRPQQISSVITEAHDLKKLLIGLAIVWTFAAFGEELGYRAYLMTRFGEMTGGGRLGKAISLLAVSVLFGFGHFYKGPAGILESTASGLLLGGVYLAAGNLWAPILAHGLSDTYAIMGSYLGWSS
jgi:uncharacterized protein